MSDQPLRDHASQGVSCCDHNTSQGVSCCDHHTSQGAISGGRHTLQEAVQEASRVSVSNWGSSRDSYDERLAATKSPDSRYSKHQQALVDVMAGLREQHLVDQASQE